MPTIDFHEKWIRTVTEAAAAAPRTTLTARTRSRSFHAARPDTTANGTSDLRVAPEEGRSEAKKGTPANDFSPPAIHGESAITLAPATTAMLVNKDANQPRLNKARAPMSETPSGNSTSPKLHQIPKEARPTPIT